MASPRIRRDFYGSGIDGDDTRNFDPIVFVGKYDQAFDRAFFAEAFGPDAQRAISYFLRRGTLYEVKGFERTQYKMTQKGKSEIDFFNEGLFGPAKVVH